MARTEAALNALSKWGCSGEEIRMINRTPESALLVAILVERKSTQLHESRVDFPF